MKGGLKLGFGFFFFNLCNGSGPEFNWTADPKYRVNYFNLSPKRSLDKLSPI